MNKKYLLPLLALFLCGCSCFIGDEKEDIEEMENSNGE